MVSNVIFVVSSVFVYFLRVARVALVKAPVHRLVEFWLEVFYQLLFQVVRFVISALPHNRFNLAFGNSR